MSTENSLEHPEKTPNIVTWDQPWLMSKNSLYIDKSWSNVDRVIKHYLMLNRFFFGMWIYLILIIVVIIITRKVTLPDSNIPFPIRTEDNIKIENVLIEKSIGISDKDKLWNDISVVVKQWELLIQTGRLVSVDNLLTYKWFTLPKRTDIYLWDTTWDLQDSSYFVSRSYSIDELDKYLNKIIYNNYVQWDTNYNRINSNQLIQLKYPLIQYFGMQCMLYSFMLNPLCEQSVINSLWKLSFYKLSNHYDELSIISQKVQWTSYENTFCEAIKVYLFISNDTTSVIKEIMVRCGQKYENLFSEFSSFRIIQDQLNKQSVLPNVTSSAMLNSYKLLSIMQEIHNEVTKWNNINDIRIASYIEYVRSLLKNTQYIQWFYMDVIVRYNSQFLSPVLTRRSVTARGDESLLYRKLLLDINELNEWSTIKWFTWLKLLVSNADLISNVASTYTGENEIVQISLTDRFNQSYTFSNYVILTLQEKDENTLMTTGRLRFDSLDMWLSNNTPLDMTIQYIDNRFYVTSIAMSRHLLLALTLNQKLTIQPLSINELYQLLIQTQSDLLNKEPVQWVCESFKDNILLVSCSDTKVTFENNNMQYIFSYTKEQWITDYTISNPQWDQWAKNIYGPTVNLTRNSVDAINIILNYKLEWSNNNQWQGDVWWLIEVQIQNNFLEIWAEIQDIKKSDMMYIVDFKIQNYLFTSIYKIEEQRIMWLWLIYNGVTYNIRNFSFGFIESTISDKNLFKNDPRTFLLQYDPLTIRRLQ